MFDVACQGALAGYYNRERKQVSSLIPDYQVLRDGKRHILADAKYKLYEEKKVSPADLYQLTVYSLAGGAGTSIIYYPASEKQLNYCELALPRGGAGIRVYLLGIPLNSLLDKLNPAFPLDEEFKEQTWSLLTGAALPANA